MDLSKLPRMSNSPEPPPPPPSDPQPQQPPTLNYAPAPLPKMEAWFSIFVGLILVFGFPQFFEYAFSPTHYNQNNPVYDGNGNQIPYSQSDFFLPNMGEAAFGVMLIVDGLILALTPATPLVAGAFCFAIAATLLNLFVVIRYYNIYGLQLINALAVGFGIYIASYQWRFLQIARGLPRKA